jgi:hypothetical protein
MLQNYKSVKFDSITRGLVFYLTLTIVFVSFTSMGILYFNVLQKARHDLQNKSEEILSYLTESLAVPIWNVDDSVVIVIGKAIARENSIAQLEIIDYTRKKSV